jgi:hypothetical protein|uniref:phage tail tape measure protein n=1 Tax=Butyricimonas faecalis TaxID=2093856 RepID=UPI003FEED8E1
MSVVSRLKVWLTADTKEFEDRLKKSKKEVGGFSGTLGKLKGLVGKAFAAVGIANAGRQLVSYGMKLDEVREKMERLTGIDDTRLAGEVKAIADVFEQDYTEVLRTANSLTKQFGITFGESMTLIRQGFADGLNDSGDFLDQLREYAPQFKAAGLSARGMLSILQTSVRDGVFSDKGLDAIKEGMLRIREMPKATREALEGIGIASEEVEKALKDGSMTIFDVLRQVSEKLNELPENSVAVGTAIANIFGGPGEDAGVKYLKTLKDINLEHESVATEMGKAQDELAQALGRLNAASAEAFKGVGSAWTRFKTEVVKGLASEVEVYNDEEIGWFQKWVSGILPGIRERNYMIAEGNRLQRETNQNAIDSLKLRERDVDSLRGVLDQYIALNTTQKGYFAETVKAIRDEIALRLQGVEAIEKAKNTNLGSGGDELSEEEKVRQMVEGTVEAIGTKIQAYEKLKKSLSAYDIENAVVYQREINRLQAIIEKQEELVNSRLRNERDLPVMEATPSYGLSVSPVGFDALSLLPEQLAMSRDELQPIVQEMIDMSGVIGGAFSEMATGIGENVGQLISSGGDLSGFASLVETTFADMAIRVGKIAIETGTAVLGIKAALKSLNPWVAIAAGVALVALGTAVKGALSNVADGGSSTFSSNTYSNNLDVRTQQGSLDRVSQSVNVEVSGEFKLQGGTLVAAINKENKRKNLTT